MVISVDWFFAFFLLFHCFTSPALERPAFDWRYGSKAVTDKKLFNQFSSVYLVENRNMFKNCLVILFTATALKTGKAASRRAYLQRRCVIYIALKSLVSLPFFRHHGF